MFLRRVTDQMGRRIQLPETPQRIVSLVPSQTELLYDLGLGERVVAQTLFCVHPEQAFRSAVKIGGTKKLNLKKIRELKPDLIIGNKEENERGQIEALWAEFPVWMSDITTPQDALEMIQSIGDITDTLEQSVQIVQQIRRIYSHLEGKYEGKKKAVYLIWKNPWMAAGNDTYIHHMLDICGYENLVSGRYPELDVATIKKLEPQAVLLSSEPFPFKEEHLLELQDILPKAEIKLVDGEFYSWYGSRLLHLVDADEVRF